jgi:hypothetical protein
MRGLNRRALLVQCRIQKKDMAGAEQFIGYDTTRLPMLRLSRSMTVRGCPIGLSLITATNTAANAISMLCKK